LETQALAESGTPSGGFPRGYTVTVAKLIGDDGSTPCLQVLRRRCAVCGCGALSRVSAGAVRAKRTGVSRRHGAGRKIGLGAVDHGDFSRRVCGGWGQAASLGHRIGSIAEVIASLPPPAWMARLRWNVICPDPDPVAKETERISILSSGIFCCHECAAIPSGPINRCQENRKAAREWKAGRTELRWDEFGAGREGTKFDGLRQQQQHRRRRKQHVFASGA